MPETAPEIIERHAKNLAGIVEVVFEGPEVQEYQNLIEEAVRICLAGDFHQADTILHQVGLAATNKTNHKTHE